jgi:glycerophosphoryl diester phosphodiesterase
MVFGKAVLAVVAGMGMASSAAMAATPAPRYPHVSVYAHRGASALLPEHTLAAYAQAISDGADYIEPDLVMTRDGVMVARHENEISATTDVAGHPEFASRRTAKVIDGETVEGWFTEDFTLAELKTLRARERLPELRGTVFDGEFRIVTLDEIVAFLVQQAARADRGIGLAPEIKHGSYFRGIGLPMEERLLETLRADSYTNVAPILIQSFETASLRQLRARIGKGSNIRLLQLLDAPGAIPADVMQAGGSLTYARMMTPAGLREIAGYADAVGVDSRQLLPLDARGELGAPTALIADAHAAGLAVVAYTFRPENPFLPPALRQGGGNARNPDGAVAEIRAHLRAGIDAFFTDDPALGRRAVDGDAVAQGGMP